MKILSVHTTGEESPGSGSSVFQRTFSVALHVSGTLRSGEVPSPCGPRQEGQLVACKDRLSAPRKGRRTAVEMVKRGSSCIAGSLAVRGKSRQADW
ncbi:MAG: hypothetical protein B9S33_17215 [Pedosphaera sp. Tous-C6FEB]|nr:MAG: hypothetical protein B9S33_17215 [Pedosphaera sp. Tous-C6FEB]